VVGLTGNAEADERARCLAAGMDDFVPKPMNRAALVAAIERARAGLHTRRGLDSRRTGADSAVA
jgi:CheY-like chemotaxis protein